MNIKYIAQKYNLLILCAVITIIWLFFGLITDGGFLSSRNISNLFRQMSIIGIMSVGMSFVIITGNIDLSMGSMLGLLGAVAAILLKSGLSVEIVLISTIILGAFIGCINGWWYAYRGVPAFIVTLSGLLIYRGIVLFITRGQTITIQSDVFNTIGSGSLPTTIGWMLFGVFIFSYIFIQFRKYVTLNSDNPSQNSIVPVITHIIFISLLAGGFIYYLNNYRGIPFPVVILLIIVGIAYYVAENTVYGRTVYAIGGNSEAAKYSGVNIKLFSMLVFLFNGLITGVASIINTARLASAVPSTGVNTELDAIAACVIGGISLVGGTGSILGALLGALIIASINNGMSFIGLDSAWQNTVKGAVLLGAVWIDVSSRSK